MRRSASDVIAELSSQAQSGERDVFQEENLSSMQACINHVMTASKKPAEEQKKPSKTRPKQAASISETNSRLAGQFSSLVLVTRCDQAELLNGGGSVASSVSPNKLHDDSPDPQQQEEEVIEETDPSCNILSLAMEEVVVAGEDMIVEGEALEILTQIEQPDHRQPGDVLAQQ